MMFCSLLRRRPLLHVSADARLAYNVFDLEAGRRLGPCDSLSVRPFGGLRFAEIRFVPHLWLASDQPAPSPEALRKLCEQAEAGCFITPTVKGGVGAVVLDDPQLHQA